MLDCTFPTNNVLGQKKALTIVVRGTTSVTDVAYLDIIPKGAYHTLVHKTSYIEHLSTKPKQKING
jgi:hypothetical protein